MPSNAQKGSYYKGRAKKYFEREGYVVANLEDVRMVYPPGRRPFAVKRDQMGADLLAVSGAETLFVQVKFFGGGHNWEKRVLAEARAVFNGFPCPPNARQIICVWRPGQRRPELLAGRLT